MIKEDYKAHHMTALGVVKGFFTGHTFILVLSYRLGNWLHRHRIKLLPALIKYWQLRKFACELSPYATIGARLKVPHSVGIVVGHEVVMGDDCELFQNVTIGSNRVEKNGRFMPVLGNHVTVCSGAVIVGPITIGNNVVIGANSFVNRDIPDNTVVAGCPAVPVGTELTERAA